MNGRPRPLKANKILKGPQAFLTIFLERERINSTKFHNFLCLKKNYFIQNVVLITLSNLDLIRNEVKKDRERNGLTNGQKDRDEPTNGQTEQFSGQAG